jgi:tryptophan 2,3-dioxygenase
MTKPISYNPEPGADGDARAPTASNYSDYLQLPGLLGLQKPLGRPLVHDEMLFIIVHQAHELWFKQMILELRALIADTDAHRFTSACRTLDRLTAIASLLGDHMRVLETMPAHEFARFRSALGTASGLESEQFRRIQRLAGLASNPEDAASAGAEPAPSANAREAFWRSVASVSPSLLVDLSGDTELGARLRALLESPALTGQRSLALALLRFDEQMVAWRRGHFELARSMLGGTTGTGGSTGAAYLHATMERRFFPELWHWRTLDSALSRK